MKIVNHEISHPFFTRFQSGMAAVCVRTGSIPHLVTTSHRVYAFILRDAEAEGMDVLLSAERFQGVPLVKFPGGGKSPGESDEQCLVRELFEELQLVNVRVGALIHQSKAPVQSQFDPNVWVSTSYYLIASFSEPQHHLVPRLTVPEKDGERVTWCALMALDASALSLSSDRDALHALKSVMASATSP